MANNEQQRASQMTDIQFQAHHVTQYIRTMQQRDETMVQVLLCCYAVVGVQ